MRFHVGAILIALVLTTVETGAQNRVMVLEGGTLIDGTGKPPVTDAVVVVDGNRIKAVGRRGRVTVPANANVIRLNGRTILPGLVDTHVHLIDWHLPMFLPYGVTTIVDLHNDTAWDLAQREALKTGVIKGPRLFISGARIVGPNGPGTDGFLVKDVPEARAYVRRMQAIGIDVIKVAEDITDAQLKAIIEEANAVGLKVLGHTQNIKKAVDMGMKHEEHMNTMARALLEQEGKDPRQPNPEAAANPKLFPGLIDYMVSQGVYINPTLVQGWYGTTERWRQYVPLVQQLVKDPKLAFVPADIKATWVRDPQQNRPAPTGYANIAQFLKMYSAAGGKVLVATDAGLVVIPGLSMHQEMQMLIDLGISPMKAIQGATLWAAEAIGKEKDLGSIEPGKLADFAIIEGDPLADIAATRNVRMVIKDGEVMDTSYDPNWLNPITFCAICHKGWPGQQELAGGRGGPRPPAARGQ